MADHTHYAVSVRSLRGIWPACDHAMQMYRRSPGRIEKTTDLEAVTCPHCIESAVFQKALRRARRLPASARAA